MKYSFENKGVMESLEELAKPKKDWKKYDWKNFWVRKAFIMMRKNVLEAITKTVTEISEQLFEESKATTKTNGVWNE